MKTERKVVLIPVDFGMYSYKSINYAKMLSDTIDGEIHLLHVVFAESWWSELLSSSNLVQEAEEKLKTIKKDYDLPENTVCKVLSGTRYRKILEYADEVLPRYIITADNHPTADVAKKLGPTLSQIVTLSKHPVVTVKNDQKTLFKDILLPLDLANETDIKLQASIRLAKAFGSKIHIVSVLFDDMQKKNEQTHKKVAKHTTAYEEAGIAYDVTLIEKGDDLAYREILDARKAQNCDAILIMTHNENSFDNYLGTFAQHIINKAEAPVISFSKLAVE